MMIFEEKKANEQAQKELELQVEIENEMQRNRDADQHSTPCAYKTERHANEALAIRYGIANQEMGSPRSTIRLLKTKKVGDSRYEVLLTDHGDRKAIAVIEVGTDYVKTFLPLQENWFTKFEKLETTLKDNKSFSLKELARFHVDKVLS
jgi:hypothetical protein